MKKKTIIINESAAEETFDSAILTLRSNTSQLLVRVTGGNNAGVNPTLNITGHHSLDGITWTALSQMVFTEVTDAEAFSEDKSFLISNGILFPYFKLAAIITGDPETPEGEDPIPTSYNIVAAVYEV